MRVLTVSDGFSSSSAPSSGSVQQNALASYASTADFVAAKGSAAADGDKFYDTANDVEKLYRDGAWTDVVTKDQAQVLTAKDIDGGTASNSSRLTLAKAASATLAALTRKAGNLFFDTTKLEPKFDDGTNLRQFIPAGVEVSFPGTTAPDGWLFCRGQAVSRTTYADLFAAIGTAHGSGDGSTTFNLPDRRGMFLRGVPHAPAATVSARSGDNVTATSHGFNRTGVPVQVSSIVNLTGLSTSTTYYVIVVDDNTIAFASTEANAIAGTKITLGGASVSATITQFHDPDGSSRTAPAPGGNTGVNVGAVQSDQYASHIHNTAKVMAGVTLGTSNDSYALVSKTNGSGGSATEPAVAASGGNETRPRNALTNWIIKT